MSIPDNFKTTIVDFVNDLSVTFPEYSLLWDKWKTADDDSFTELFEYCKTVYPERFFDVLYQNNEIFDASGEVNTFFLPGVDFKMLFNCEGVSEKTKQVIWKYIQLILFTIVGSIKDKSMFKDTANLFDGIEENELEEKLKSTMEDLGGFFKNMGLDDMGEDGNSMEQGFNDSSMNEFMENLGAKMSENLDASGDEFTFNGMPKMPNMEGLHEHLKGLFDGKIGKLAKELAEEISGDFSSLLGEDIDTSNPENLNTKDILKQMIKNPKKMMKVIKDIGTKIQTKMDDGEISKDELMGEASDILSKMKEMGGADQFGDILKKFAGGMGMGKNAKIDKNALNRMAKSESMRERMLKKMEENKQKMEGYKLEKSANSENLVFSLTKEEKQERSIAQKKADDELVAWIDEGSTPVVSSGGGAKKKPKKKGKSKK